MKNKNKQINHLGIDFNIYIKFILFNKLSLIKFN